MLGRGRELVEKPDKEKPLYRITQKGKDYRANPPKEPQSSVGKVVGKVVGKDEEKVGEKNGEKVSEKDEEKVGEKVDEEKTEAEKKEGLIPSQADIFRSIADQLSISKAEEAKGGASLSAIVNFVERTADMDDLNSLRNASQAYCTITYAWSL